MKVTFHWKKTTLTRCFLQFFRHIKTPCDNLIFSCDNYNALVDTIKFEWDETGNDLTKRTAEETSL